MRLDTSNEGMYHKTIFAMEYSDATRQIKMIRVRRVSPSDSCIDGRVILLYKKDDKARSYSILRNIDGYLQMDRL